jgi:hypothetical protein
MAGDKQGHFQMSRFPGYFMLPLSALHKSTNWFILIFILVLDQDNFWFAALLYIAFVPV